MFLSGIDISGIPNVENYKFMAIVMGTSESIDGLYHEIDLTEIHMSRLPEVKQQHVIEKLDFDGINRLAFCISLDREQTVKSVKNNNRIKRARLATEIIYKKYDQLLQKYLRPKMERFTILHRTAMSELVIQRDDDTKRIVRNWSLRSSIGGKAYEISDAIAYCNHIGQKIDGVTELDFRDEILEEMYVELLK